MEAPVRTAMTCDEAFNRLYEAERDDEITDDPRLQWYWLANGVKHATWVSAYLGSQERHQLEDLYAEWQLRLAPRLHPRPGEPSFELQTPGFRTRLLERCQESAAAAQQRDDYTGESPLSEPMYIEVAKEGIFDWSIRSSAPTFELRCCLQCSKWFTPQRSGRARFCGSHCRNRFNNIRSSRSGSDMAEFECATCAMKRPLEQFSGLRTRYPAAPPIDLEMAGYVESYFSSPWCIACIFEHRPQWRRYVATVDAARVEASR